MTFTIIRLGASQNISRLGVRYAWKRTFDDRTFWALYSALSKLATIHRQDRCCSLLRLTPAANLKLLLPQEEKLLLDEMLSHRPSQGMKVNMLDGGLA